MAILTALRLLKMRRTKIVATLGPASAGEDHIAALVEAGVDVFRLNFSHGSHADHALSLQRVRAAADRARRSVAVLADLCGPKIRVGRLAGGRMTLVAGDSVTMTTRDVIGDAGVIPSQYAGLADDVRPGARLLLADGLMELRVERVDGSEVHCSVVQGGELTDRKGINLPDVAVSAPSLTDKDRADAAFILDHGIDFLALSFVRQRADLDELRSLMASQRRQAALVAKIERPEALDGIDGILDAADAIMVARGDLGVELPPEQIPHIQAQLLERARQRNRPVIIATQMLESMIEHARPTRAEVTDVSHSVATGADAVMLSAETASGRHPLLAVQMMDRVARQAEADLWHRRAFASLDRDMTARLGDDEHMDFGIAVARATALLSRDLAVRAVVVFSESGTSAQTTCAARPAAPIIVISSNVAVCRRMALTWGAAPVLVQAEDLTDRTALARRVAGELGVAAPGQYVLAVQGFHAEHARNAPSITLLAV